MRYNVTIPGSHTANRRNRSYTVTADNSEHARDIIHDHTGVGRCAVSVSPAGPCPHNNTYIDACAGFGVTPADREICSDCGTVVK